MFHRYDYEAEIYPTLSRLPLELRRKLDICGIKISLKDWLAIGIAERRALCHLPCDSAEEIAVFGDYLESIAERYRGTPYDKCEPADLTQWNSDEVPPAVLAKSAELGPTVTPQEWRRWQSPQRYALYKTAVSHNQPEAFERVLAQLRRSATEG
jgi:hypothetical protein